MTSELTILNLTRLRPALVCTAVLVLGSCGYRPPDLGPPRTEPIHIASKGADHANVELDIGAGQLTVNGGARGLVDGSFEYNANGFKPIVESSINGTHAVVTIRQSNHDGFGGNGDNNWNLSLSDKTVLDLAIHCGAGQADLKLGDIALRSLDVQMGAGQVNLDLSGTPKRDYEVNISGGVGEADLQLPQNVGIRADAHGGLGSIDVSGLKKIGDHYENELYDKGKVNVRLTVEGGIGAIRIHG